MIEITNLHFSYPGSKDKALDDVSLTINEGALFGLLGPNGAGKSTLLNILSGLLEVPHGHVRIDDKPLESFSSLSRPPLALVPQQLAFYETLTARENLAYFAACHGIDKHHIPSEIERCIELSQLGQFASKRAGNCSGGVKRRLNLAIGLLGHPRILFLDEPTVGIDAQSRNFILESISDINQSGTTVIYTSHYMEEVQQLCNEIAIIDNGKIMLQGNMDTVLKESSIAHIQLRSSLKEETLRAIEAHLKLPVHAEGNQIHIELNNNSHGLTNILNILAENNIDIESIAYGQKSLESFFLDMTKRELRE